MPPSYVSREMVCNGMTRIIAQRFFDLPSQHDFAVLSGDRNPLHLDREFARRSPMGDIVVHGVHILLWALQEVAGAGLFEDQNFVSFDVNFLKPLYIGEIAALKIHSQGNTTYAEVVTGDLTLVKLSLNRNKCPFAFEGLNESYSPAFSYANPIDRSGSDFTTCDGSVPLASLDLCSNAFPDLALQLGSDRIAGLLACTRIVGMECPGLYSLLSSLSVNFVEYKANSFATYSVARYDPRFRAVRLAVRGGRVDALVSAFSRQPPVTQPTTSMLSGIVDRGAFSGQRALIVGGSRGLGEVTAKAIAAGGGEVIITYATAEAKANDIAHDIRKSGGICAIAKYDVRAPAAEQLSRLPARPTHVYYFATPRIFRRNKVAYDPAILREFLEFYVDGFSDLFLALSNELAGAFYPSSAAVAESVKGLFEYSIAKAAGEELCSNLRSLGLGPDILVRRLPRVLTDQTASVALVEAEQAQDVMLPIIIAMQDVRRN
jgi:acyl dehydratase